MKGTSMHPRLKRTISGAAAFAVTAGAASTLLSTPAAYAAGANAGPSQIIDPATGNPVNTGGSATPFTLKLPAGAACTGDSANANYRVFSYMVPVTTDPSTLTFGSAGPTAAPGEFRAPLYKTTGSPYVNVSTSNAVPAGGPGQIIQPLPAFDYKVFGPGIVPSGAYNIGIACTLGPAGPTQEDRYWNTVETVTTDTADSPSQIRWDFGAVPAAPVLNTVTPGNTSLTASYTAATATPAATTYTITATPPSGPPVTATGTSTTGTVAGLTNGTAYSVTVSQANSTGTSPASNAISATPAAPPHPAVTNLTATPGTGKVDLSWTAPADAATTAPTGYSVTNSPAGGTTTVTGTTASVTGLTPGTPYTFTVTANYAAPPGGTAATTGPVAPLASQVITQNLTVTRPTGALVFTQVCGANGSLAAEAATANGFPALTAVPAASPAAGAGAPTLGNLPGGAADPMFPQYPYPQNADGTPAPNYPTNCGVALGIAKFISSGPGGGKFFAASGVLNQVTVVDTRDTDIGWTANGNMGYFSAGPGKTFSGSQLGWSPARTSDTAAFTDSDGVTYDQVTNPGAAVLPNTPNATGLSSGRALGTAAALAGTSPNLTGGLGIATFDARLKLLIPVTAKSGSYSGTLTISAI